MLYHVSYSFCLRTFVSHVYVHLRGYSCLAKLGLGGRVFKFLLALRGNPPKVMVTVQGTRRGIVVPLQYYCIQYSKLGRFSFIQSNINAPGQ